MPDIILADKPTLDATKANTDAILAGIGSGGGGGNSAVDTYISTFLTHGHLQNAGMWAVLAANAAGLLGPVLAAYIRGAGTLTEAVSAIAPCANATQIAETPAARQALVDNTNLRALFFNENRPELYTPFLASTTIVSALAATQNGLNALTQTAAIFSIPVANAAMLNSMCKSAYAHTMYNKLVTENFDTALETCANNTSYFQRKAVAARTTLTTTLYYHNISSNTWVTALPTTQKAVYFVKTLSNNYGSTSGTLRAYYESGKFYTVQSDTSGVSTNFEVNKGFFGALALYNWSFGSAWSASTNTQGEAFLVL